MKWIRLYPVSGLRRRQIARWTGQEGKGRTASTLGGEFAGVPTVMTVWAMIGVFHFLAALTFAHLALCAAAIRRRAAADSLRLGRLLDPRREFTPRRASMARSIRLRSSSSCLMILVKFAMARDCNTSVFGTSQAVLSRRLANHFHDPRYGIFTAFLLNAAAPIAHVWHLQNCHLTVLHGGSPLFAVPIKVAGRNRGLIAGRQ